MGSSGMEESKKRKAMWLYPKVMGFNPSERWGHSACFSDGVVYVFGGCCGGLRFSDVLTLSLETMTWSSLSTNGLKPGTRDSHSSVLVGEKMYIFGGTNGTKKVNDLHVLNLRTKEWSRPNCKGITPIPRESHTATVIGENKLVIFGGSGEGDSNYLNDVHVLDLNSMTWASPDVKGDLPAPRDSHTAVAIGNKLYVYGGDCGDHYHGEVDVLDVDNMTWSRLALQGSTPGVRAGHAAASTGNKIYILGGVGDKHYYSDVWVLDVNTCTWTQLDVGGQRPQGRFSHTAVATDGDIMIFGGCGEDERPLNELLILQLGSEHPNGRYNVSMCKIFGKHWSREKRKPSKGAEILQKGIAMKKGESLQRPIEVEPEPRNTLFGSLDSLNVKKRKINDTEVWNVEWEQEEHTLSISQHSSPSLSDHEQNTAQKLSSPSDSALPSHPFTHFKLHPLREQANGTHKCTQDVHFAESPRLPKTEHFVCAVPTRGKEMPIFGAEQKPQLRPLVPPLIGAEVRGTVDGAFDSGYLMTANVKGQILRGVLFAPVPITAAPRPPMHCQPLSIGNPVASHQCSAPVNAIPTHFRPLLRPTSFMGTPECGHHLQHSSSVGAAKSNSIKPNNDLQGVVLTLAGPGGGGH